jgi:hypothetical protein
LLLSLSPLLFGNRATGLPLGPEDSWGGGMVRSVKLIIRRGDTLYIYYCGIHAIRRPPRSGRNYRGIRQNDKANPTFGSGFEEVYTPLVHVAVLALDAVACTWLYYAVLVRTLPI